MDTVFLLLLLDGRCFESGVGMGYVAARRQHGRKGAVSQGDARPQSQLYLQVAAFHGCNADHPAVHETLFTRCAVLPAWSGTGHEALCEGLARVVQGSSRGKNLFLLPFFYYVLDKEERF